MPKLSFKICLSLLLALVMFACTDEFEVTSQEADDSKEVIEKLDLQLQKMLEPLRAELHEKSIQHSQELQNQPILKSNKPIQVPADYPTIQEAVDAAPIGGSILVSAGTYNEIVSVVTPGLTLMSEDGAHLMGDIRVFGENIEIKGFKISGASGIGIYISYTTGVSVKNNSLLNNNIGVLLDESSNCSIKNNDISDNSLMGVVSLLSKNNEIKNNTIVSNVYGIYQQLSTHETYKGNVINENTLWGIIIDGSNDNAFIDNEILGNWNCDVLAFDSYNNIFRNNTTDCFVSF